MMISFTNDYSQGACPQILTALAAENLRPNPGYGCDSHCAAAAARIRALTGRPDADVHFLVGGTPANLISLTAFLRPHQAAIAATTGHIAVHESGAIEGAGHKVCTIPAADGKLTPALVRAVCAEYDNDTREHMVQPKLVYISDTTEIGTVYTKSELAALREVCNELGLYLYLDGARLASALTCAANDLTLADIAALTDAFYLGGTKNGALMGEALVILNSALKPDFRYIEKQRGGMLAKGWLLGLQFEVLLADGLWFELARHANAMAMRLAAGAKAAGAGFAAAPCSNQLFVTLPQAAVAPLAEQFGFELWGLPADGRQTVRFVCSWATREEEVDALVAALQKELSAR